MRSGGVLPERERREVRAGWEPGLWGIVLAAGEGLRLQAFLEWLTGRVARKQFCAIGGQLLIRETFARAEFLIPRERLVTVVGADHYVHEAGTFMERVRDAKRAVDAHPDLLVLLGVEAESPETGYGWIAAGDAAEEAGLGHLRRVERFREKPDPRTAAAFLAAGFLWNTLVLVARVRTVLGLFAAYLPELTRRFAPVRAAWGTPRGPSAIRAAYADMPTVTVSRGILERNPPGLRVLPVRGVLWSDWGSAARICQTLQRVGRGHLLAEQFRARGMDPAGALAPWCGGLCRAEAA